MKEVATTELLEILNKVENKKNMDEYIENLDGEISKSEFFNNFISKKKVMTKDIAKKCKGYISSSYLYEILNGTKTNPSRDVLLIICIAFEMDTKETRRALEVYHLPGLYPKNPRDAIILSCINNKQYNYYEINDLLEKYKESPL